MSLSNDMLIGAAAIAEYTGFSVREIRDFAASNVLPIFKIGKRHCARKSELCEAMSGKRGSAAA